MMHSGARRATALIWLAGATLGACTKSPGSGPEGAHGQGEAEPAAAPTNRVAVPAAVRQNLGITFALVERRAVARTIRVPGRFELTPSARREYHAPVGGRVELLVEQYQAVEAGTPLYRLDSPGWRAMQREIAETEGAMRRARAQRDSIEPLMLAHVRHEESLEQAVELWQERVTHLESLRASGGGRGEELVQAQAALRQARSDLAEVVEKDAELEAQRLTAHADLEAAEATLDLVLAGAATVLGESVEELTRVDDAGRPRWRTLTEIEVRAVSAGVVESLPVTNGAWVEERSAVLASVQPGHVRFRARGLQSDLGRLRPGLGARVVPPSGGSIADGGTMAGSLEIGLVADPDERTVDLLMTPATVSGWARAGVSGFLEIDTEGAGAADLAIPLSCVIRDGLTSVIFRRDPSNPDQVIRLEADLGIDDGRWIVVKSGVRDGDEIVLDGVYQLMLATSGTAARGGHFHSDGTFHEGED